MPHIQTSKVSGRHTTAIDAAMVFVKAAQKHPAVSKIILGIITQTGPSRGGTSLKISREAAGLKLKVRGNTSVQEIRVYTADPETVEKELEKL